jgi:Domain of unknown function (DUF4340)
MKRLSILIGVLILAVVIYFIFRKDLNQTSDLSSKDFAIPADTKINKFFYAANDKSKGYLTFTRNDKGEWWVENGKNRFKADTNSINDLLQYVLPKMQIQSPVNDAALDHVNRQMALNGVKAQFYVGSELIKTFYVGDQTADDLGTYMYLPGSERPCVVKIPGHNGYLTPFFNTDIQNWRSLDMMNIPASDIDKVSVVWAENPGSGFTITKNGDEPFMQNQNGNKIMANKNRMLAYLDMLTGITREAGGVAGINKTAAKDSILATSPFFSISVTKTNGQRVKLNLYRMKVSSETYSPETRDGSLKVYEVETYWGSMEGSGELWVMQDAVLKNRMKRLSDFIK